MECMTDEHRSILRKARVFLVEDLDVGILDHLVSAMILTAEDEERINAERVRHDKVKRLLELLPRRGDEAYDAFLQSLKEQQDFLYEKMKALEYQAGASSESRLPSYFDLQSNYENRGSREEPQQRSDFLFREHQNTNQCHQRNDDSLMRELQNTRGIHAQATDNPQGHRFQEEDIKPHLNDLKSDPMDSFGMPAVCLKITGEDTGQVIDPMRTTPRNPNKLVDSKALSKLASNLGSEWEALAMHMGFASNKLYHWKENSKYNVWGQVFAFLNAWKNSKGNGATIERLISEIRSFPPPGVAIGAYRHLFFE